MNYRDIIKNLKYKTLAVEACGETFYVRELSAGGLQLMAEYYSTPEGIVSIRQKLLALVLCDDAGRLIYEPSEYAELDCLPKDAIAVLWDTACDLNQLGDRTKTTAADVESDPVEVEKKELEPIQLPS